MRKITKLHLDETKSFNNYRLCFHITQTMYSLNSF